VKQYEYFGRTTVSLLQFYREKSQKNMLTFLERKCERKKPDTNKITKINNAEGKKNTGMKPKLKINKDSNRIIKSFR